MGDGIRWRENQCDLNRILENENLELWDEVWTKSIHFGYNKSQNVQDIRGTDVEKKRREHDSQRTESIGIRNSGHVKTEWVSNASKIKVKNSVW